MATFFPSVPETGYQPILQKVNLAVLINPYATSRSDYCNILYVRLPLEIAQMLQLVQNTAAHLLMDKNSFNYVTPLLNTFPGFLFSSRFVSTSWPGTCISEEPSVFLEVCMAAMLCGLKLVNDAFPQSDTIGYNPLPCLFQSQTMKRQWMHFLI